MPAAAAGACKTGYVNRSRAARVVRGSLAAAVATFVALVSHVTGGGQLPGWVGIVVPLVLSVAVCTVLAGRRLSLWRLSIAVAVSQILFHTLFVLGTFSPSPGSADVTVHHMHGASWMPMGDASNVATSLHPDVSMWVMHGIAAIVTIAALYLGERAYNRLREITAELAQWARRHLLPVLIALPFEPVRPLVAAVGQPFRPACSPLARSLSRRGPPVIAVL